MAVRVLSIIQNNYNSLKMKFQLENKVDGYLAQDIFTNSINCGFSTSSSFGYDLDPDNPSPGEILEFEYKTGNSVYNILEFDYNESLYTLVILKIA